MELHSAFSFSSLLAFISSCPYKSFSSAAYASINYYSFFYSISYFYSSSSYNFISASFFNVSSSLASYLAYSAAFKATSFSSSLVFIIASLFFYASFAYLCISSTLSFSAYSVAY